MFLDARVKLNPSGAKATTMEEASSTTSPDVLPSIERTHQFLLPHIAYRITGSTDGSAYYHARRDELLEALIFQNDNQARGQLHHAEHNCSIGLGFLVSRNEHIPA